MKSPIERLYWTAYYLNYKRNQDFDLAHYAGSLSCMANFAVIAALPFALVSAIGGPEQFGQLRTYIEYILLAISIVGLVYPFMFFKKEYRASTFEKMKMLGPQKIKTYIWTNVGFIIIYSAVCIGLMLSRLF